MGRDRGVQHGQAPRRLQPTPLVPQRVLLPRGEGELRGQARCLLLPSTCILLLPDASTPLLPDAHHPLLPDTCCLLQPQTRCRLRLLPRGETRQQQQQFCYTGSQLNPHTSSAQPEALTDESPDVVT